MLAKVIHKPNNLFTVSRKPGTHYYKAKKIEKNTLRFTTQHLITAIFRLTQQTNEYIEIHGRYMTLWLTQMK